MQRKMAWPDLRGLALVVGTTAWLAGILLDAWVFLPSQALLIGSIVALLCILALWRNSRGRLIALIAFCLLFGAWRYATVSPVGDHTAISAWIGASAQPPAHYRGKQREHRQRCNLARRAWTTGSTDARQHHR